MTDSVQMEEISCPLGCSKNDGVVLTGRDLLHDLPGEFSVVKCQTCGLMRTSPRPTPETIGFYYPDNYGPYIGTRVSKATSRSQQFCGLKKLLRPVFKWIFKFNTEILPQLPPGRLLEIGCASGAFLHKMAGQGWKVEGIEFSEKAAQAASALGYIVHVGSLEKASSPEEPYDLIVGWMVLEHLHDLIGDLIKLNEWSKPNAIMVLSVPNAASLEFKLFREKWFALQLPTHLYHFTPETLNQVLLAGGWVVERVFHQRVLTNLIVSIGYHLMEKGYIKLGRKFVGLPEHAGYWSFALYPFAWVMSALGQTGRMTIWAKKSI